MERKSEQPNLNESLRETADFLIRIAIKSFMRMHDVDLETAQRWIARAAVAEAKHEKPAGKSRKAR